MFNFWSSIWTQKLLPDRPVRDAGPEEKFRFAFRLFDLDNDGLIDVTDMFDLCRTLTPPGLTEAQLLDIVEEYLARFPTGVNYEIFTQMIDVADLAKFTLNSV